MFKLSLAGVLVRFYLMMGVVIIAGFTGMWWLAVLALPIFLSIMMGYTFKSPFRKDLPTVDLKALKGDQVQKKAG